jgi:hypothetical protein
MGGGRMLGLMDDSRSAMRCGPAQRRFDELLAGLLDAGRTHSEAAAAIRAGYPELHAVWKFEVLRDTQDENADKAARRTQQQGGGR